MPIHSCPLPFLFRIPNPGPPLHRSFSPNFHHSSLYSLLTFTSQPSSLSFQFQDELYSVSYRPQDLSDHKSQGDLRTWDDECIPTVADFISFQPAILWQCWKSVTSQPMGVLRTAVHISDKCLRGWSWETHMPGTILRGREWPWLFCHPGEKAKECAKLATVALFLFPGWASLR